MHVARLGRDVDDRDAWVRRAEPAAQRLLALDPGDVAALTFELAPLCDQTAAAAAKELADLSDPLLDVLAQRHTARERPLFAS